MNRTYLIVSGVAKSRNKTEQEKKIRLQHSNISKFFLNSNEKETQNNTNVDVEDSNEMPTNEDNIFKLSEEDLGRTIRKIHHAKL